MELAVHPLAHRVKALTKHIECVVYPLRQLRAYRRARLLVSYCLNNKTQKCPDVPDAIVVEHRDFARRNDLQNSPRP